MALTDTQAKIIAANRKKREEEAARALAANMLANAAKQKTSFPTVNPSKVVKNQVQTPLKSGKPVVSRTPAGTSAPKRTSGSTVLSDYTRSNLLERMTDSRGQLYTPLDIIRYRASQGESAASLAAQARGYDNDDWRENLRKAAEERVARREELDSYVLSEADQQLPVFRQQMIREAKAAWDKAKEEGSIEGVRRAHEKAENVRGWSGYSGGSDGSEYITADLTWDEKRTLNQTGQNKLKKAKLDRQKAWEAKDAKGVQDATRAMAEILSAPGYRANPSDIGRPTDAYGRPMLTSRERLEDAARAMAGAKAIGTGIGGSLLSLAETGNQAMRNYTRDRWGHVLEANANQTGDPALADAARKRLGESTIVDPNLPGQSLMRKSQDYAQEALDGTSGVGRFLGETVISLGQNLPGIAISMIPGAQAAGLALLGAQAAGSKAWELNEQSDQAFLRSLMEGGDPEDYGFVEPGEALLRGILSGSVELLTEKIPLDHLRDILMGKNGQKVMKNILTQMGMEATEEGTAYSANYVLDKLAQDPNAEWTMEEFLKNAAMGAVSGGALATVGSVAGSREDVAFRTPAASLEQIASEKLEARTPARTASVQPLQEAAERPVEGPVARKVTVPGKTVKSAQDSPAEEKNAISKVSLRRIETPQAVLEEAAQTLGESGSKALLAAAGTTKDPVKYFADFARVYNQALTGTATSKIQAPASLNDAQVMAAYTAGQNDRAANLETAKAAAQYAPVAGDDAGLIYDDYVKSGGMDAAVASEINTVAKQLGLRVQMVDAVAGGTANAEIQGSVVRIEKGNPNPVRFLFGHEMTHRLQELAPESYQAFRDAVMQVPEAQTDVQRKVSEYKRAGVNLTTEQAMDEIAADYAGALIEDQQLLSRFIQQNKKNQSLLGRFLEALKDLARKLTGSWKKQADDAVALLEKAVDDASRQARKLPANKNTAQTDGVRYSLKSYSQHQLDNWAGSKKIVVYQNESQLRQFIQDALNGKNLGQKMYFGAVPADLAARIKQDTGLDVEGYNCSIAAQEIRKIFKDHGDPAKEALRGQRAIVEDDIVSIPEVIQAPDTIDLSPKQYNGRPVINFVKELNGRTTVTAYVSGKHLDLTVQTMFAGAKKGNLATPTGVQAPINTPEANGGTVSKSNVAQKGRDVNGRFSLKTDSQGRTLSAEQAEYFKDSQVRNEDGNLVVVYHGSREGGFTVFNRNQNYYTDNREMASSYAPKGELYEGYLNITNPFVIDADGAKWSSVPVTEEVKEMLDAAGSSTFQEDGAWRTSVADIVGAVEDLVFEGEADYDGVIVRNVDDTGSHYTGDGKNLGTDYITFSSNQFKNVDNRNPTDDPDIRRSLKGASSYTYQKLQEENRELRDRVDYWKGQTKRTQRVTTDKKAVDKAARELVSQYGADIDVAQIQGDLQGLYDYLASGRDGDNDLTYEAARERAVSIAEKLVYNAQAQDDGAYQQYGDLRKFLKETKLTVTEADSNDITDYADFRRGNLRYFNLSKGQHTNVDQVYQEMSERWPEFFDENRESNISDQLRHISDVMADIYNITAYNPFSSYTREAIAGAANEIMEKFFDLPQTKATFADRQAARLGREKARGKQKLQEEREKKNAQLEKLRQENRERVAKAVQTERDRREKALAKVKAKYKAKDEAGRERRKARELRSKITRHANALRKKLIQPSDNQHIPEKLRTAVASVLNAINLESGYAYDPATMHQVVRKDGKSGGVVGKHVPKDQGTPTKRTQAFQELRLAYEKILSEADQQMVIDPDLMTNIQEMEALKDTPIGDLSVSQLTTMWNTIKAVEASITSYNKMFGQQRFETIREVADGLKADNAGKRDRGDYRGPIGAMDKLINAGMLTPESFFHRLGKTGESLFRMLRNAQDKHIGIMQEAQKYTEMVVKDVDVRKLEKETHTFDVEGQQVTMTTAQIMSLYELMKRQQAIDHVVEGGIRVEAVSKGLKKKGMSEAIRVSPEKVGEILGVLTPKQIEIADGLQKFMGDRLSQLGNEASMEVYGYEKFKEQNYFPIKVDSNQTITDQAKDAVSATIAGRGFTKGTKPHADNALMVRNIFDVYADHVTDMATYSAWLAPMENLQRVFNFKFRDEKGNLTGTVKGLIHRIYGQNGEAYWKKLTEDLNNGVKGVNDNPFQALIGNYKASAIGANIRVFIQQPTSILRALDSISPADFMAGLTKANPNTWKKVKEYAPIAVWKDWGYFDADTGRQMKSILFGDDSRTAKVNNALMAPAGAMDSLAWSHIWNALEVETARKHKNLQKGSDDFYKKVAERFNEVVDHTQVVDGILQRSQVMRSPDGVTKMATSFMAEPTKIFNMFTTAAYDLRKSQDKAFRKKARKTMARTSVALFMSFVANAAAQSLVDAFRDDDKDEEYWEKFFQAFVGLEGDEETKMDKAKSISSGNMGKALNPFGYLPFVKDIVSLTEGYDVARMDMESISNVVSAVGYCVKSLNGEGKMTPANALLNLAAELSRFLGTPVSNIKRDVMAGINTWLNLTDNYKGQYAVAKALYDINYTGNKGMFLDIAYLAWRDGDEETFIQISQDLMDAFPDKVNGETIESAMKSRTKKQMEKDMEYKPGQTLEDLIGILPEYAEEEEKEEEFSAKNLNAEEYNRFVEQRADSYRKYEDAVTSSSVWGELDDKAKDKVIGQLWKYAAQTALEDVSGGKFVMDESSMVKAKKLEEDHQVDPGIFFTLYGMTGVLESDKTVDGETISDSLGYKKLMAVRESGLLDGYTDDQRDAVYGALDISAKVQSMSEDSLNKLASEIDEKKNAPSFFADFPEEKKDDVKGLLETLGSFQSDYDGNGKAIKGRGKQDKIKAELYAHYNSGEYTAHQCYLLWHEFYTSDKNNPWAYAKNG